MKATFKGDGNVLHLDLGRDYMDVYTCKILSRCPFKICVSVLYCI